MDGEVKEIYHRLKNHLAVVNSLIRLKASGLEEESARTALEETGGLVSAVTLVYQLLYQEGAGRGIPVSRYLRELMDLLEQSLSTPHPVAELELPGSNFLITPDKAVPLGILTAELFIAAGVTGSSEPGVFLVEESGGSGGWRYSFRGLPASVREELMLSGSLAVQLEGEERFSDDADEQCYNLIFPKGLLFTEPLDYEA